MNPAQSNKLIGLGLATGAVGGFLAERFLAYKRKTRTPGTWHWLVELTWKKEENKDTKLEPATDAPESKMLPPPPMAMNEEANNSKLASDQEKAK